MSVHKEVKGCYCGVRHTSTHLFPLIDVGKWNKNHKATRDDFLCIRQGYFMPVDITGNDPRRAVESQTWGNAAPGNKSSPRLHPMA